MKKTPPNHLTVESRALWRQLVAQFSLDDAAAEPLLLCLCEARDRGEQARQRIEADGPYKADRFGQLKAHPAITVERDARGQILASIRALKLSPEDIEQ